MLAGDDFDGAVARMAPVDRLMAERQTRMRALVRSFIPPVAFTARDGVKALLRGGRNGG